MKLTKEQIERIKLKASYYARNTNKKGIEERRDELWNDFYVTLGNHGDHAFFGPFSANEILSDIDKDEKVRDDFYIMALEDELGKSTRMIYDRDKMSYSAKTPNNGDKLVYDPKDVELGFWDKICAFFGIETDHAKKVAFAKKSIEVQKEKLSDFNKKAIEQHRYTILGSDHRKFNEHNEHLVQEAERIEDGFKKLFFGNEAVEDYKFKNGDTLSALTACIAMYHQEGGKDLANMSLEEINKPANASLRNRLREIGNEYKSIVSEKTLDEQLKYLDDFLFTTDKEKYNTRDKKLLSRIATDREFKVDWDKVKLGKKLKFEEHKKELAGAKVYTMFKVKGELRKLIGKEFPDGKKNGFFEVTDKDLKKLTPFKDAREYKLCVDEIKAENYMKAAEHLGRLTDKKELEGFEMKPENYSEFINKANKLMERKEVELKIRTEVFMEMFEEGKYLDDIEQGTWELV